MSRSPCTVLLVPFLLLASAAPLRAGGGADWPQFHGPRRDNRSPDRGLLPGWPAGGPPLVRKITGIGTGYSGPALAGDRLYLTGVNREGRLEIHAFTREGKKLWTRDHGPAYGGRYPGSRATPTVVGPRLYLMSGRGLVRCYETAKGKALWSFDFLSLFPAPPGAGDRRGRRGPTVGPRFGYAEAVLVLDDRVICTPGAPGAWVIALDRKKGTLLWKYAGEGPFEPGYCAPIAFTWKGIAQVAINTVIGPMAFDPAGGRRLWHVPHRFRNPATPLVHQEGFLLATSGYGRGAIGVELKQTKKGIEAVARWTEYALDNHHGGVVLHEGRIYGASHNGRKVEGRGRPRRPRQGEQGGPRGYPGHWVCLDLKSGKVHYAEKGIGKGCLTYADGRLYCLSEHPMQGGVVALVEPTPKGYKVKGSFKLPASGRDYYWAHPVVLDGRLYLRHRDTLYIYDVKKKPRSL